MFLKRCETFLGLSIRNVSGGRLPVRILTSASASAVKSRLLARDVRAIPIKVITTAKGNSSAAAELAGEWVQKIKRYTEFSEVQLKPNPKNAKSVDAAVQAEGERMLKSINGRERVILLDERGRDLTSEGMADIIAKASDLSSGCLTFAIGGPYGHSAEARLRADDTIRLSSLVMNHQVAHIVLLEQIYRGWTILRGEPYHH